MEQLSGLDAMFVHAEMHGLPMHISCLTIYDPATAPGQAVEFRQIVNLFESVLQHRIPLLRHRLVEVPFHLDQPYWAEDPNFDLVYHIRHIALPKPGNWPKLCSLAANLHAQPLNRERPLWEAYIIDGLDHVEGIPPGCFALLLKIHHSIMDGRTGLAMFTHLHTSDPTGVAGAGAPSIHDDGIDVEHRPELKLPGMLAKATVNNVRRTGRLLRLLGRSVRVLADLQLALNKHEINRLHKPKTRFNGQISPRRVVDRIRMPLGEIKQIKALHPGLTVNDVALAIVGGALRHYLAAKDELPMESLVAAVPIDIRGKEERSLSGNSLSITNVSLRTDVADPAERLLQVHQESRSGKHYADTLGNTVVSDVLDNLYAGVVAWGVQAAVESGLLDRFAPVNNTIVTNVPGSPVPLYLCGARMIDSFGMGPLIPNTGLFHTVSSTDGYLTIAFTADRQKMADPDVYADCLRQSFMELLGCVAPQESDSKPAAVSRKRKSKAGEKK